MSLNKKVLTAAIVGALMIGGSAVAAPLSVTEQYYAQEIVIPVGGLVPTASPSVTWASGYNYGVDEIKYVRIELTGATWTGTPAPSVGPNGTVGAINGIGTNVLTFSVTSTGPITATDSFTLPTANVLNIPTKGDVSMKVSLYDQASQAQAGGDTGLLAIGSYDDTVFLSFARSYAFTNVANTLTADVASAAPAVLYGNFLPDGTTTPATTLTAGTLNDNLSIGLVDPDGAGPWAGPTLKADGSPIALTDLFGAASVLAVEGDFSAATSVTLGVTAATPTPSGTPATYPGTLTWTGVPTGATAPLVYNVPGNRAIPAGDFKATFNPVAASPAYTVTSLTANVVGSIRRNGLELQAPFVQRPNGWDSRIVLTNTGSNSPKYTISVLGEDGNTIGQANLEGTVDPGTNVINLRNVMTSFSGAPRGTVVVHVEQTDAVGSGTIQGLYQLVNASTGASTNHVMVRPGTN